MLNFINNKTCLFCENKNTKQILNLGEQPLADSFIPKDKLDKNYDTTSELTVCLCNKCKNIQLETICPAENRYTIVDYSYTSSNSNYAKNHWNEYANSIESSKEKALCVEIGSNDGYLIEQFKSKNFNCLGIDPSPTMNKLANNKGIETITSVFNYSISEKIINKYGKAELIIANNVFNHSDEPKNFMMGIKNLLSETGTFILEVPYWKISVDSRKIDQVYFEHVTYITATSIKYLTTELGLYLNDIKLNEYHGGSIRLYISKKNNESINVKTHIEKETYLFSEDLYKNIMNEIKTNIDNFHIKLNNLLKKDPNTIIIGIGAAAKGNTFLNLYKLNNKIIKYITDTSKYKQGKYTPNTRIPIVDDNIFSKFTNPYAIMLSWNISDFLKNKLREINPNIIFLN